MIRQNQMYKLYYENSNDFRKIIKFQLIRRDSLPFLDANRHSIQIDMKNFKKKCPKGNKKARQNKNKQQNRMISISNTVSLPQLVKNVEQNKYKQKYQPSEKFHYKILTQPSQNIKQKDYGLMRARHQYRQQLRSMKKVKQRLRVHHILGQAIKQARQNQSKILEPKQYPYCFDL